MSSYVVIDSKLLQIIWLKKEKKKCLDSNSLLDLCWAAQEFQSVKNEDQHQNKGETELN